MAFKKGDPNINRSGRAKGSKNVATRELREAITIFTQKNVEKIDELWNLVAADDPAKAIELLAKILNYSLPQLRSVEHDISQEEGITEIKITLAEKKEDKD